MNLSRRRAIDDTPRGRGDSGTAILEFTLVAVLLFTLIFGIISYGLILSFKQDMTRAAAEGARAGAVAFPASTALADATAATNEAVKSFSDRFSSTGCATAGMTCTKTLHDCGLVTAGNAAIPDCITVDLVYDYQHNPLVVPLPLISAFLPTQIRAKSDARVNQ